MKKTLVVFLAMAVCLQVWGAAKTLTPIETDKVSMTHGNITFEVNPNIEVLAVISRIAGMETANDPFYGNSEFLSGVDTFFEKHKKHSAVKQLQSLIKKHKINFDDMISLALVFSDDMTKFTVDMKNPPSYVNEVWKKVNTQKFLEAVNAFAVESKFTSFYSLNRPKYINMVQGFYDASESGNVEAWINSHYMDGEAQNIKIHVSELLCGYSYHFEIPNENKKSGFDYVLCESPYINKKYEWVLARAISRSYVAPKIERIWSEKSGRTINALKTIYEKQGYKSLPQKTLDVQGKGRLRNYICDTNILGFFRDYCGEDEFTNYYDGMKQNSSKEIFDKFEVSLRKFDVENGKSTTFDDYISEECDLIIEILEYQAGL